MTMTSSVHVEDGSVIEARSTLVGHVDTYLDESGFIELVFSEGQISKNSRVFASVTEIEDEEPIAGEAMLTVQNVIPRNDTLVVRVVLEPNWGRHVRLYYLITN